MRSAPAIRAISRGRFSRSCSSAPPSSSRPRHPLLPRYCGAITMKPAFANRCAITSISPAKPLGRVHPPRLETMTSASRADRARAR